MPLPITSGLGLRHLATGLLAVYGLFFVVPQVREFFELTLLDWPEVVLIGLLAVFWAALVMSVWRGRVYDRVEIGWRQLRREVRRGTRRGARRLPGRAEVPPES